MSVFIIDEARINYSGSYGIAKRMVDDDVYENN